MNKVSSNLLKKFTLPILLLIAAYVSLAIGEMGSLSIGKIFHLFGEKLGLVQATTDDPLALIFWELRLPRTLLGILVGANVAVAGALMQSFFRNPLADPYVAGVSSGAACGAVIVLTTGVASALPLGLALSGAAFAGGILVAWIVFRLSTAQGRTSTLVLLLGGIALGGLLQAVTTGLILRADPYDLQGVIFWLMGSLAYRGWEHVLIVAVGAGIGLCISVLGARTLDLLAAGEESAAYLGLPVQRIKKLVMAVACFLAATSVAACGVISFIGLMAPHLTRMLFGAQHTTMLPQSALLGAFLLTVADLISRSLLPGQELPIGIVTGVLGAAFLVFLLLIKRQRFV